MMSNIKILIIDDEPDVTRAVRLTIMVQSPGWHVVEAHDGAQGLALLERENPNLVLLDLAMPGMNGFEVLEAIRLYSNVPVIILSVRSDELEKVRGLQLGADDYIVKPFGHLELMARIRSVLRRAEGSAGPSQPPLVIGDLRIDFNRHEVTLRGEEVNLTKTEFQLLAALARNAGHVVTYEALLSQVWGREYVDEVDYLKVFIYRLRRKIEQDPAHPRYIFTERGVGYRLAKE